MINGMEIIVLILIGTVTVSSGTENSKDAIEKLSNIGVLSGYPVSLSTEKPKTGVADGIACEDLSHGCRQKQPQDNSDLIGSNINDNPPFTLSAKDRPVLETDVKFRSRTFVSPDTYLKDPASGYNNFGSSLEAQISQNPIKSQNKFPYMNTNFSSEEKNLLPKICGFEDTSPQIVGGDSVPESKFPWMVALLYDTPYGVLPDCGGTLISKRYVLTAAHCIKSPDPTVTKRLVIVRLGSTKLWRNPKCTQDIWNFDPECTSSEFTDIPIERIIVHIRYDWSQLRNSFNDIALLKLSEDVKLDKNMRPICLPSSPEINDDLIAAGWGLTENKTYPSNLLRVNLPLASCQSAAIQDKKVQLRSDQICAGGESLKDTCNGDSGGPLMDTHETNKDAYRVVGITSHGIGNGCGNPGIPAVYTRVYSFVPWILSNIELSLNLIPNQGIPVVTYPAYESHHLLP